MSSLNNSANSNQSISSPPTSPVVAPIFWAVALIGPMPFALVPILGKLGRIESLPIFIFSLVTWATVLILYAALVRSRWNHVWLFPQTRISRVLLIAGIACQVGAMVMQSSQSAAAGWILLIVAWLSTHTGKRDQGRWRLLSYLPAAGMLWPVPAYVAATIEYAYQHQLGRVASLCLDLLGLPFRQHGLKLEFATFNLSIEHVLTNSPLVGWMLFISCLAFSWLRRPIMLLPAYLIAAIGWAFGMHLVQVCVIGMVRHTSEINPSMGWPAVLLSMTTLAIAIGLMLSTDRGLRILFMPVPLEYSSNESVNPFHCQWNRMLLPLATDHYEKA